LTIVCKFDMNSALEHYLSEYNSRKGLLAGNGEQWIEEMREQAINRFHASGFPTRRNEEWKYTDLAEISGRVFNPLISRKSAWTDAPVKHGESDGESIRVTFENGCWLSTETGLDLPPPGVTITSLGKMLTDFPDRIKQHLALFSNPTSHELVPVNTAFASDGAFIHVERGVALDRPLELLFTSIRQSSPHLSVPRNLIILEEGASATIVEKYTSPHKSLVYWNNVHTEIVLEPGARLNYVQLQNESAGAYHTNVTRVRQARDSRFASHVFSLGGRLSRNDLDVSLEARGAECELNGLYMTEGDQHMDHHTRIDHIEPDCTSSELYKGILADSSRGVFNGKVYVHPDAQRTSAMQSNPNLLLSRKAEVDTKPQLEIFADDVKCSHGATVGQLEDEALFFLRSRGINEESARKMLLNAFAEEVVNKIDAANSRNIVAEAVTEKVQRLTGREDN